jgi:hypothetical protein
MIKCTSDCSGGETGSHSIFRGFPKIAVKAYEIYVNFPFNILLIPSYSGAILVKVGDK